MSSALWIPGRQVSEALGGQRLEVPTRARVPYQNLVGESTSSSNASHTKGAWVEWAAALTDDVYALFYASYFDSAIVNRDFLVDIGVGGAGAETVLVENLCHGMTGTNRFCNETFMLPIFIRKGTRVAVRNQYGNNASDPNIPRLHFLTEPIFKPPYCRRCDTYGAVTADSGGTSVEPGGTINTKGAYSQLVASTTKRTRWLMLKTTNQQNSNRQDYAWQIDVATGGAGSESNLITDLTMRCSSSFTTLAPSVFGPFPVDIPEGTRLSVRALCSGADTTDRIFDAILYGFSL